MGRDTPISYVVDLAKKNSEALSYIPYPKLEQYYQQGNLMVSYENESPCGFLVHGWPFTKDTVKIWQACIDEDMRRSGKGVELVSELITKAILGGYTKISLRCADDLSSNLFWSSIGFSLVKTVDGGQRRQRVINIYEMELNSINYF